MFGGGLIGALRVLRSPDPGEQGVLKRGLFCQRPRALPALGGERNFASKRAAKDVFYDSLRRPDSKNGIFIFWGWGGGAADRSHATG